MANGEARAALRAAGVEMRKVSGVGQLAAWMDRRPGRAKALAGGLTVVLIVLLVLGTLTSCSSGDAAEKAPAPVAASTSPTATSAPTPATAGEVVAAVKAKVSTATKVTVWTAETDPNHLIGRPGGSLSAASVLDRRTGCSTADTSCGVMVEVFPSAGEATKRSEYIQGILRDSPAFGSEYHYLSGVVLLRVSGLLSPAQAKPYEAALLQVVPR